MVTYDLDNIVTVAATDHNDEYASFSNYGDWVDLAAPGVAIVSTVAVSNVSISIGITVSVSFVSISIPALPGRSLLQSDFRVS